MDSKKTPNASAHQVRLTVYKPTGEIQCIHFAQNLEKKS